MEKDALVGGRYRIRGTAGDALLAENVRTGVRWVLRAEDSFRSPAVASLLAELRHPALPRVLERIEHEGRGYLVLEYLEGETLEALAERSGGRLTREDATRRVAAVARAVDFLHWQEPEPILHLDVKPSNVVADARGGTCLIDFGAALPLSEGRRGDALHGTPGYAAPEVVLGRGAMVASDVYAIGATLVRLLTGRAPDPAHAVTVHALHGEIGAPLARIAARCCAPDPDDRYGSANEVAADLEALLPTMGGYAAESEEEARTEAPAAAPKRAAPKAPARPPAAEAPIPSPLCVWDGAEFGCELAAVLATGGRSVLVVDADLLNPRADLLLGLREERRPAQSSSRLFGGGGLDEAMEEHARGRLTPDAVAAIARPTAVRGVAALAGDYRMEDYEYYSADGLAATLRAAGSAFDVVVVLCGRFLYDAFTCLALMVSEVVVVPVRGRVADFREFNRYIGFLASRRQLDRARVRFVAFEHHAGTDLGWGTMDELAGGAFCGCIAESSRRRAAGNAGRTAAASLDDRAAREYRALLPRLRVRPDALAGG